MPTPQSLLHVGLALKSQLQYIAAGEDGEVKWQALARKILADYIAAQRVPSLTLLQAADKAIEEAKKMTPRDYFRHMVETGIIDQDGRPAFKAEGT